MKTFRFCPHDSNPTYHCVLQVSEIESVYAADRGAANIRTKSGARWDCYWVKDKKVVPMTMDEVLVALEWMESW